MKLSAIKERPTARFHTWRSTTTVPETMKSEPANIDARQPDYLKLGYEFSFKHGLRAVLFDRQSKEHSETLMSRVLSGFMRWSAGHWIAHHIKKQLPDERIASDFIKNIRKQGGVSRDELVDFISETKIKSPGKEIFPENSSLDGDGKNFLSDAEKILIEHLTNDEKINQYREKFTKENIEKFLKFIKNNCKINDPSDSNFIKNLKDFSAAVAERRRKGEYSFFILRNNPRIVLLKRELKFLEKKNGCTAKKINYNQLRTDKASEDEYRKKLKDMPAMMRRILKNHENSHAASHIINLKSTQKTEEERIASLKLINSRAFIQYFKLGFINNRNFAELSDLAEKYKSSKSNLRKNLSQDLGAEDPLYAEILDDTIIRLEEDLRNYSQSTSSA